MRPDFQEEWLTAYLDDELDEQHSEIVRQRLESDAATRQLLEDLKRVRQLVGSLPGWTGGDLHQQFASVATTSVGSSDFADEHVDLTDDIRVTTPNVRLHPIAGSAWPKWLGLCALAASFLIVAGLSWTQFLAFRNLPSVALQNSHKSAISAAADAKSHGSESLRDETGDSFRMTPALVAEADSARPMFADGTTNAMDRRGQTADLALAERVNERMNSPQGISAEAGMGGAVPGAPSPTAALGRADSAPRVPLDSSVEFRQAESLGRVNSDQLALLPPNTRVGRSQAWKDEETSLAISQVAQLIAPNQVQSSLARSQVIDQPQQLEGQTESSAEKSRMQTRSEVDLGANVDGKLDSQRQSQLPMVLLQVADDDKRVVGILNELVTYNQELAFDDQANSFSKSIADAEKEAKEAKLGFGIPKQEPSLSQSQLRLEANVAELPPPASSAPAKPQAAQRGDRSKDAEQTEPAKSKEENPQFNRSRVVPSENAQKKNVPSSGSIVLLLTRREAQRIIDAISVTGKDSAQQSAGQSANAAISPWWILSSENNGKTNDNPDDKVIMLLNSRP